MNPSTRLLCLLFPLLWLVIAACRSEPSAECAVLVEAQEHEAAAEICTTRFAATGDPAAGRNAAEAYIALGRDSEAREVYKRVLERQRQHGEEAGAARSLYKLFYLSWKHSDLRPALEFAQEAAQVAAAAGEKNLEAAALQGLLALRYDLGDLEGARHTLKAARERIAPGDRSGSARLRVFEGTFRLHERRFALARDALGRALEEATGNEEAGFFRSVQLNLVEANLELGDLEAAEKHLTAAHQYADDSRSARSALAYYRARLAHRKGEYATAVGVLEEALQREPIPEWSWRLQDLLGQVEEARGQTGPAEAAYRRAIAGVEAMRREVGYDDLKAWLLDARRRPFEALFRLQIQGGRLEEALATVERAKARSFLESFLENTTAAPKDGTDPTAAARRFEAVQGLWPVLGASPVVAPRPVEALLSELRKNPEETLILLYFVAGEEVWLLTIHEGRILPQRLGPSSEEIADLGSRFLAAPDETETAERLGTWLLPPRALPARGSPLYLVTDNHLGRLPFAALLRGGRYLVEDHTLLHVPSLHALVALRENRESTSGPSWILGDPRGDLPAARREAREVAARISRTADRLRIGEEATLEALRRSAGARLLHLATHLGSGPQGPWLALADGEMGAGEIVAQGIAPRTVVLAGCAGAGRRGSGLWGSLGAAFLAAGSRNVLASLTSLEDEAARRFLLRFYEEGGAENPADALRRTQQHFVAADESPAFWAPFVLFGVNSERPLL